MRVCLIYDCLYPCTIGGAERWYRNVGERLAAEGHEVTYLTLRQWERSEPPDVVGVDVVAVGPRLALYTGSGRRRVGPPVVFGLGVLWHLLRYGRRYDVIHTASFPYFSLLAAALTRPLGRFRLIVDWHELWSDDYWRDYLGPIGGRVGAAVQLACLRVPQRAFCFAYLTARRLREHRVRGEVTVLEGEYEGGLEPREQRTPELLVVFAGRHIPEKQVPALVPAIAAARERVPGLRGVIFGDGPERRRVLAEITARNLGEVVEAPGFVDGATVEETLSRALCMALPSRREGYGLIVVEAASMGVPSVVVRAPDNAAADLVADGENGFVVESASTTDLAEAIERVALEGGKLRDSTTAWFARNAVRLSLESSLKRVVDAYGVASSARS